MLHMIYSWGPRECNNRHVRQKHRAVPSTALNINNEMITNKTINVGATVCVHLNGPVYEVVSIKDGTLCLCEAANAPEDRTEIDRNDLKNVRLISEHSKAHTTYPHERTKSLLILDSKLQPLAQLHMPLHSGIGLKCQTGQFSTYTPDGDQVPPCTSGYISGPGYTHCTDCVQFTADHDGRVYNSVPFLSLQLLQSFSVRPSPK